MPRPYHTLLVRDSSTEPWRIEFGDYDSDVVLDEQIEYLSAGHDSHNLLSIRTESDDNGAILAEVKRLNESNVATCPACGSANLAGVMSSFLVDLDRDGQPKGQWIDYESSCELSDSRECSDCNHSFTHN